MQSVKNKDIMIHRDKYPHSQYHFFFTAVSKDYLVFFGNKRGYTVMITQGTSKKLNQFQMEDIVPIHFASIGRGDIAILYQNGIMEQYVEMLTPINGFHKIEFERKIKPKKLIKIQDNDYIIVTQAKTLVFLKDSKIVKQVQYPSQMLMQRLELDCARREPHEPRLVVPHQLDLFPFIFSVREVSEFCQDDYLQSKIKKYEYYQDEKLPCAQYKFCFSASQNKIYLLYKNEMIILKIKFLQTREIDYTSRLYFRYKTKWNQVPQFVSASNSNNTIILINSLRFCEITPDKLGGSTDVSIKQKIKDNRMVTAGYGLSNSSCVFLTFDAIITRLFLI